jgi:hypothetical protein
LSRTRDTDAILESIDQKLAVVVKVIGLSAVIDKPIEEQVRILASVDLNSVEIGNLLGKDDSTIRGYLMKMKKGNKQSMGVGYGKGKKSKTG